jgi:hypothetical protein
MSAAEEKSITIVQLSASELRTLIRDELEHFRASNSNMSECQWTDTDGAAKHFAVTGQTIRNWIRIGAPARQIGTSAHPQLRIDLVEFDRWVRAQKAVVK